MFTTSADDSGRTEYVTDGPNDSNKVLFIPFAWLGIIVGSIGIVGNGFVLMVILGDRKQSKTKQSRLQNPLLINQTCVDFATSALVIGTYVYKLWGRRWFEGRSGLWLCVMMESEQILWICLTASAFSLEAITIERLFKIVFPIMHRNNFGTKMVFAMIIFTWLFPIAWQVPMGLTTSYIHAGVCFGQARWINTNILELQTWGSPFMTFICPAVVFVYSYSHILYRIYKRNTQISASGLGDRQSTNRAPSKLSRAQINITLTMIIVCACFIILWFPSKVYYMLAMLGVLQSDTEFYNNSYYFTFLIISFINSVINPFIYVFKLSEFRKRAKVMLNMSTAAASSTQPLR